MMIQRVLPGKGLQTCENSNLRHDCHDYSFRYPLYLQALAPPRGRKKKPGGNRRACVLLLCKVFLA